MTRYFLISFIFVFSLIVCITGFGYLISEDLISEQKSNGAHIQTVSHANSISSYVKRAEGHLYMYLMLSDELDRTKYLSRLQSLNEQIQAFRNLNIHDNNNYFDRLSEFSTQLSQLGGQLISLKNETIKQSIDFPFAQHDNILNQYHEVSSKIRHIGVELVEFSTSTLGERKYTTLENIRSEQTILILSGLISILLIISIAIQTDKLIRSRQYTRVLDKLSNMDALTGVANRRSFENSFNREWKRSIRDQYPISIMMIDVDHFKLFNDHYGHVTGDMCLGQVARALQSCLKRPADMIARYGGEEFVILMPETKDASVVAEECRGKVESLQIKHAYSSASAFVTVSIGVGSCIPTQGAKSKDFLSIVDEALYSAKSNGRNRLEQSDQLIVNDYQRKSA